MESKRRILLSTNHSFSPKRAAFDVAPSGSRLIVGINSEGTAREERIAIARGVAVEWRVRTFLKLPEGDGLSLAPQLSWRKNWLAYRQVITKPPGHANDVNIAFHGFVFVPPAYAAFKSDNWGAANHERRVPCAPLARPRSLFLDRCRRKTSFCETDHLSPQRTSRHATND